MNPSPKIEEISVDMLDEPLHAMRTELDPVEILELADDIKRNGLIQPIVAHKKEGRFEVVAGHRRLAACRSLGWAKIPCIVRELTEREVTAIKLSENLNRKDINPLEEAAFYAELVHEKGIEALEISKMIGRSEEYVLKRIELLTYPPQLLEVLNDGKIGLGAASWLAKIKSIPDLDRLIGFAVRQGISTAEAENWYRNWDAFKDNPAQAGYEQKTDEELKTIARPQILCQKCGQTDDIRQLTLVHIHKYGCPPPLLAMNPSMASEMPGEYTAR